MTIDANRLVISCELREETRPPTLLLRFLDPEAATWLRSVFFEMPELIDFDLTADSTVELLSPLSLRLVCSNKRRWRKLVTTDRKDEFSWIATPDDWETYAALLEPFTKGEYGHQYLTNEVNDDLLIEVSFGERINTNITGESNGAGPILGTVDDNQLWSFDQGVLH